MALEFLASRLYPYGSLRAFTVNDDGADIHLSSALFRNFWIRHCLPISFRFLPFPLTLC